MKLLTRKANCQALLFNARFLHVLILFVTATAVVLSENTLVCLPCKSNLMISKHKIWPVIPSYLYGNHFQFQTRHLLWETPAHAKSDASQKIWLH